MKRFSKAIAIAVLLAIICIGPGSSGVTVVRADSADAVAKDLPPEFDFPDSFTFIADITAPNPIESVELQYVALQDSCVEFFATAYPTFEKSTATRVTWKWDLKQSGGLPIGTTVSWNWKVTDSTGHVTYTPIVNLDWFNYKYSWQQVSNADITVYWIDGDQTFGEQMLREAQTGLTKNLFTFGLKPHKKYKIFVYPDNETFRADQLYESSWTGGLSYTRSGVVALGINPNDTESIEWGKSTLVHELTHAVWAQKEFTCVGSFPTWLPEGVAQYVEFSVHKIPERDKQAYLDYITDNGVFSLRTMNEGFGTDSTKVGLLYTQSYYTVKYLVDTFGRDKFLQLYQDIHDGIKAEDALRSVYSLDFEELEQQYATYMRASVNPNQTTPTMRVIPTFVPTIIPINASGMTSSAGLANTGNILIWIVVAVTTMIFLVVVVRLLRRRAKPTAPAIPQEAVPAVNPSEDA
jgi:hypothetical protein